MQRIFLFVITFLSLVSCREDDGVGPSNEYPSLAFIWQGFYHDWTYNHRMNRMGDWISDVDYTNGLKANFKHSAASGIGADVCSYATFATVLATRADIQFVSGHSETIIKGVEGTVSDVLLPVHLEMPLVNDPEVIILLNGFDMYARPPWMDDVAGDGAADKLFHFTIHPENIEISTDDHSTLVEFDLYTALGLDCTSPECINGPISDFFDYIVHIGYQVITGPSDVLAATSVLVDQQYAWEPPNEDQTNEIFRDNLRLEDVQVAGRPGYGLGVPGISSISFDMEKGLGGFSGQELEYQHMLNFDMALIDPEYDPVQGQLTTDIDLFFKNWAAPIPVVSFGGGGSVEWQLGLELVQINDAEGRAEPLEYSNSIDWNTNPFNPAWPTSSEAVKVERVEIGF